MFCVVDCVLLFVTCLCDLPLFILFVMMVGCLFWVYFVLLLRCLIDFVCCSWL